MDQQQRLPQIFINYVKGFIPEHLDMEAFISACNRPLRRSIRVNTLKINIADFCQQVATKGWLLEPIPWCDSGFWLTRPELEEEALPLGNTTEHLLGLFYIQEASSMLPPIALLDCAEFDKDTRVLDMAAAPGSKTSQISALMNNTALIIANEYSASRLKGLSGNIQRLGIRNVALSHFDGRVFSHLTEKFDYVLIDAPCSGEGTVRKDPKAMADWSIEHVHSIAQTQLDLLEAAFQALKVGGRLVYSTCTINPIENTDVCNALVARYPDAVSIRPLGHLFDGAEAAITSEGYLHVWPQLYDSEGFFIACIEKTQAVARTTLTPNYQVRPFPFTQATRKEFDEFRRFCQQFGPIDYLNDLELYLRDNEYWLFPKAINTVVECVRFHRVGLKAAEWHKKGFRLQHDLAMSLVAPEPECSFALTEAQLKAWYQGKDIPVALNNHAGDLVVTYNGKPAGCGRWQRNKIKNGLPRELVRDSKLVNLC